MDECAISREVCRAVKCLYRDVAALIASYAVARLPMWVEPPISSFNNNWLICSEPVDFLNGRWSVQVMTTSDAWGVHFELVDALEKTCRRVLSIGSDPNASLCAVDGDIVEFELACARRESIVFSAGERLVFSMELKAWVRARRHGKKLIMQFSTRSPGSMNFLAKTVGTLQLRFVHPNSLPKSK